MWDNYSVSVFLPFYLLVACVWFVSANDPRPLREDPADVSTTPGSTVTLRCAVNNPPSGQPPYNVYWYRHNPSNAYLTKGTQVFHQTRTGEMWLRLTVIGDTAAGEFFLQIQDVGMSDAGEYSCVYFQGDRYLGESRVATITVYQPPAEGYPRCSMEPSTGNVNPGQKVVLTCVSSGGEPKPRLDWMSWHEILPGKVVLDPEPKATYELQVMESDNGAVFTCVENTPATAQLRTCNLKPFHRPTNVTLVTTPVGVGEDAVFSCTGSGIPMVTNYTWSVGGVRWNKFTSASGEKVALQGNNQVLSIVNALAEDNGTVVRCHANNEVNEEGFASAQVLISHLLPVYPSGKNTNPRKPGKDSGMNAGIIVGSIFTLFILVAIIIILVRKLVYDSKKDKKASSGGQDPEEREQGDEEETQPLKGETPEIPEPVVNIHSNPRPVTICLTPRDAIVEHIRETEEAGGQPLRPAEDGSRVKVVGRLSCAGMTVDVGDFAEMYSRPVKPKDKEKTKQKQADVVPVPEPQAVSKPKPKPKPKPTALKPPMKPKPKPKLLPKPGTPSPDKPKEECKTYYADPSELEDDDDAEAIYENTYRRPDITMDLGEERQALKPKPLPRSGGQPELL